MFVSFLSCFRLLETNNEVDRYQSGRSVVDCSLMTSSRLKRKLFEINPTTVLILFLHNFERLVLLALEHAHHIYVFSKHNNYATWSVDCKCFVQRYIHARPFATECLETSCGSCRFK